jgi:hypothetical protein
MTGPDGPEERQAELEERIDAEFDELVFAEDRADEERSNCMPVKCIVNGHVWSEYHYCARCGQDRHEEPDNNGRVWL